MKTVFKIIIAVFVTAIIFSSFKSKACEVEAAEVSNPDILEEELEAPYTEKTISMIAKTIYGEARGLDSFEKSMVVWTILNRVDDGRFGKTIEDVITKPKQFVGYKEGNPVTKEDYDLALDILKRWEFEKDGAVGDVGRTLPKQYLYFYGDGVHNHFRDENKTVYYFYGMHNPYDGR